MAHDVHLTNAIQAAQKIVADREADMAAVNEEFELKCRPFTDLLRELSEQIETLQRRTNQLTEAAAIARNLQQEEENRWRENLTRLEREYQRDTDAVRQHFAEQSAHLQEQLEAIASNQQTTNEHILALESDVATASAHLAEIQRQRDNRLRRLRHGKYQDAVKRLPGLLQRRERQGSDLSELPQPSEPVAAQSEPVSGPALPPTSTVADGIGRFCDFCHRPTRPWVLHQSGLVLCLACARRSPQPRKT